MKNKNWRQPGKQKHFKRISKISQTDNLESHPIPSYINPLHKPSYINPCRNLAPEVSARFMCAFNCKHLILTITVVKKKHSNRKIKKCCCGRSKYRFETKQKNGAEPTVPNYRSRRRDYNGPYHAPNGAKKWYFRPNRKFKLFCSIFWSSFWMIN